MDIITDFEFYTWVERCFSTRPILYNECLKMGIEEFWAYTFASSEAITKKGSFVALYQSWCIDDPEAQEQFKTIMTGFRAQWDSIRK